jgi:hypothetical protein
MAVDTAAGSKFYIGPQDSTADNQSAYEALSYVQVGEVENLGEFGDQFNEVTFTALGDRRVRKIKGSKNAGNLQVTIGHDSADSGQSDLEAALASDEDYAFKVELDDAGTGSPSSPTTYYFRGKVMSTAVTPGDAESIVKINAVIGINSDLVTIAAV